LNKKEKTRFILNSYLIYKNDIKNIELEIEELENNYDLSGISLEEKTAPTNKISNAIESRAIAKPERISKLQNLKRSHEIKCEKIENSIEILKEFEKQVIELKYMTPPVMTWFNVSNKLRFSISACKQAEDRAINKMIPLLIRC
jgi:DNA-directed RNA polymerase specialized sigma subunit